jgi:hypothetical protein
MNVSTPPQPLPPPLLGNESGSFARYTVEERLPDIARRILSENSLPLEYRVVFESLIDDIPHAAIRPLQEDLAPDSKKWARYVEEHIGKNWLEIPWFFAEAYFYRRILEAVGYFHLGPRRGIDPFIQQKNSGYAHTTKQIQGLSKKLNQALARSSDWDPSTLSILFQAALWGNQADLSLWPIGKEEHPNYIDKENAHDFLLIDHREYVANHLENLQGSQPRVDFINDNSGFELVTDLCLADYMLTSGLAAVVRFHLKSHPTFVSDALPSDVGETVARLAQSPDPHTRTLAGRLVIHIEAQRLNFSYHDFWTSPLPNWEMPTELRTDLECSALVICKGDMNYRRCLGDLHWPYTTHFQEVLRYFPAPIVCLRTLKSEVVCGLSEQQVKDLSNADPDWLTNGLWGLIQFKG